MLHVSIFALVLLLFGSSDNQGTKATGELTVTAVVTSSVSITIAADGTQTISVANAPADQGTLIETATPKLAVPVHKHQVQEQIRNAAYKSRKGSRSSK